jgi:hypothetical protein
VVGLPGTDLLVFGEAHAKLGGQADKVGVAGAGLAIADIDQAQTQSPANSRVGAIDRARSHGCGPDVEPSFLGDGAIHQDHGRFGMAGDLHVPVVHLRLGQTVDGSEEHRKVRRAAARHDGVDGDLFNCRQAEAGLHNHKHVLGLAPGSLEHLLHCGRGGRDDRQAVAPVPLRQEAVYRV